MRALLVATTVLSVIGLAKAQSLSAATVDDPRNAEARQIAAIQAAGHRNDRSKERDLLVALNAGRHQTAALHALAQMGSADGLAALEKRNRESGLSIYSRVVRARLVAQIQTTGISDNGVRARDLLKRFLHEAGMSVEKLNAISEKRKALLGSYHSRPFYEVYVLRELADMIYHNSDAALAAAAKAAGIDFTQDAPAALKVRLAPLPKQERIDELIEVLSQQQVLTGDDYYTIQLAVNEGVPASRAAAAKLQKMRADKDAVYPTTGFSALFRVINGVGDKEQAPVVAQFLTDPNGSIQHYAIITYKEIVIGVPHQFVIGY